MNTNPGKIIFPGFFILLFTGLILMIIGCDKDTSGICYSANKENSYVVSTKVDDNICSCGRECYYDCYDALVKVKYDNSTCQINLGSYKTEEKAQDELEHYPEGKQVPIIVNGNSCYLKESTEGIVIAGIVFLSISGLILVSSILYFCTKQEKKSELKTNLIV